MGQDLAHAGIAAIFGMLVGLAPLVLGVLYAWRPTETRLALMRPLTLATIFAALHTLVMGISNVLRNIPGWPLPPGYDTHHITLGLSESVTPMMVAFGCLTAAWLSVAVGMRRQD